MGKPLRVLFVEDSEDDAELMTAELVRGGFAPLPTRVDTLPELRAALAEGDWDVVLSDCQMPCLSADIALTALQESGRDLPFIILSGVVRPEEAVSLLKRGAHDFLNKDALARLVPAVEREIREAVERRQRRAAEERVRILSLAVEQSPVSVVITDREGLIQYVNPRFRQVTGFEDQEAFGQSLDFARLEGGCDCDSSHLWPTVRAGSDWKGEICSRRKDGQVLWERVSVSPLKDDCGTITHFVAIKEDITDQRRRQQELQRAIDHLTETNTELERFAFVASHDLQEPLRTVILYSQLIARDYRGQLDHKADEYIAYVTDAARRMHQLINDLLDYSRAAGKGLPFSPVAAADCCNAALRNLQESIRETGARIQVDSLPMVVADRVQLMQLFQNLLGNAIKFHRPDVPPEIEVTAWIKGDEWIFAVHDNGIGVERSDQDVFEIFRRLHTAQAYPGTGVGLAICKRIVQRHNGRIWLESEPGQGATFFFTLGKQEDSL